MVKALEYGQKGYGFKPYLKYSAKNLKFEIQRPMMLSNTICQ
jgi:hypothetical protein